MDRLFLLLLAGRATTTHLSSRLSPPPPPPPSLFNSSQSYYLITSSASASPNEFMYLGGDGGYGSATLRTDPVSDDELSSYYYSLRWWILPVRNTADWYHIVVAETFSAEAPVNSVLLLENEPIGGGYDVGRGGNDRRLPRYPSGHATWHAEVMDKAQLRIVPLDTTQGGDQLFHIITSATNDRPNQMVFINRGCCHDWLDTKDVDYSDTSSAWRIVAAECDASTNKYCKYNATADYNHVPNAAAIMFGFAGLGVLILIGCVCCCLCHAEKMCEMCNRNCDCCGDMSCGLLCDGCFWCIPNSEKHFCRLMFGCKSPRKKKKTPTITVTAESKPVTTKVQNLQRRFPNVAESDIIAALEKHDGHGGEAATDLASRYTEVYDIRPHVESAEDAKL